MHPSLPRISNASNNGTGYFGQQQQQQQWYWRRRQWVVRVYSMHLSPESINNHHHPPETAVHDCSHGQEGLKLLADAFRQHFWYV